MEKYYDAWAEIMVRYLLAYREKGIEIQRITVQNEPAAVQKWDSCIYTAEEEAEFAVKYLKKHLNAAGLDHVKILVWDHNKDLVIERCEGSFSVSGAEDTTNTHEVCNLNSTLKTRVSLQPKCNSGLLLGDCFQPEDVTHKPTFAGRSSGAFNRCVT